MKPGDRIKTLDQLSNALLESTHIWNVGAGRPIPAGELEGWPFRDVVMWVAHGRLRWCVKEEGDV